MAKVMKRDPALTQAILTGDMEGLFRILEDVQIRAEAARIARGPTEVDIKRARMRRARGMPYDKWALGEV